MPGLLKEKVYWHSQGYQCHLGNIKYIVWKVYLRGFKVYFYLKIQYITCNVADVTQSKADGKGSVTNSMQVAADILPKTHSILDFSKRKNTLFQ